MRVCARSLNVLSTAQDHRKGERREFTLDLNSPSDVQGHFRTKETVLGFEHPVNLTGCERERGGENGTGDEIYYAGEDEREGGKQVRGDRQGGEPDSETTTRQAMNRFSVKAYCVF